jgi:hypothetical protein
VNKSLLTHQEITLVEALCGFKRIIKHLDDRNLLISSPPGRIVKDGELNQFLWKMLCQFSMCSLAGDIRTVQGEGMPKYRDPFEKGRLFIKFKVAFPADGFATPEQLAALERLLPPRPAVPMDAGDVEEKDLESFDPEAYTRESQVRRFLNCAHFATFLFFGLLLFALVLIVSAAPARASLRRGRRWSRTRRWWSWHAVRIALVGLLSRGGWLCCMCTVLDCSPLICIAILWISHCLGPF